MAHLAAAGGHDPDTTETYLPPRLEGYEVRRCLGTGGSAAVWLVANSGTGTERALKVLAGNPAREREDDQYEIRREMAILSRHSHPHLIAIHQFLDTDQGPALLMDYASGGSVGQLVAARGPLPVGEVVTMLTPIAQALAYLHENGVTHGDVSPGNVLFTSEGMPLLSDLGVSRLLGEAAGAEHGTPGFAPVNGDLQGRSGPNADVYALGALAWYALTGRVPAATASRPPLSVLIPGVPTELTTLIESALSESAQDRPSASEFARMVYHCAQAQPVDLVPSAHITVLPELRTRRSVHQQPEKKGFFRKPRRKSAPTTKSRHLRFTWMLSSGAAMLVLIGLITGFVIIQEPDRPSAETVPASTATSTGSSGPDEGSLGRGVQEQSSFDLLLKKTRSDDPVKALAALAELRAEAYQQGDPAMLAHVNAEGSAAMKADLPPLEALKSTGHKLAGLSFTLENIDVQPGASAKITHVEATVVTSGYTEEDAAGRKIREEKSESTRQFVFTLRQLPDGWRISDVTEPAGDTE
ncbi:serine/threonine-protein kinase [Arthrobacter roseus]|uniref:serine/threonine-protein kinase n=1 Tax=Arthrobacter roseus TaxID=136274 RepID=UPI001963B7D6|nr:serine/threonine-protein kinase [Arthrobacter roseus]MBM7848362.1 serine/threonine protein kinase [Arthrobacter roseus]